MNGPGETSHFANQTNYNETHFTMNNESALFNGANSIPLKEYKPKGTDTLGISNISNFTPGAGVDATQMDNPFRGSCASKAANDNQDAAKYEDHDFDRKHLEMMRYGDSPLR